MCEKGCAEPRFAYARRASDGDVGLGALGHDVVCFVIYVCYVLVCGVRGYDHCERCLSASSLGSLGNERLDIGKGQSAQTRLRQSGESNYDKKLS